MPPQKQNTQESVKSPEEDMLVEFLKGLEEKIEDLSQRVEMLEQGNQMNQ